MYFVNLTTESSTCIPNRLFCHVMLKEHVLALQVTSTLATTSHELPGLLSNSHEVQQKAFSIHLVCWNCEFLDFYSLFTIILPLLASISSQNRNTYTNFWIWKLKVNSKLFSQSLWFIFMSNWEVPSMW